MEYLVQIINNVFFLFLGVFLSYKMNSILNFLTICLDEILLFKIKMKKKYDECINFNQNYCNLEYYLIHDDTFIKIENKQNTTNIFNFVIFQDIYNYYHIEPEPDSVVMLRFFYKNQYYRIYLNYKQMIDGYTFDLLFNPKEIIENLENNISKEKLYFLKNETQEIEFSSINNIDCLKIIEECNGLFFDFGVIKNNMIKVKYLMSELKIKELQDFHLKYKNFHFDENKLELIEHTIKIKDKEEIIMSDLMKEIILES